MNKEMYVSSTPHETRLAINEDGELVEIYIEREKEYSLAGSIYKGRVTRVLPGMQSAFVDIGLERDAFLYVSDFFEDSEEYDRVVSEAEDAVARLETKREPRNGQAVQPAHLPEPQRDQGAEPPKAEPLASAAESEPAPVASQAMTEGAAPAATQPGGPEEAGRFRHRRGRRRRGRRPGFPESKFSPPHQPAQPEDVAEPAPPEQPRRSQADVYTPLILPGESLAKYRGVSPVVGETTQPPSSAHFGEASGGGMGQQQGEESSYESSALSAVAEESAPLEAIEQREFEKERIQPDSPVHAAVAQRIDAPEANAAVADAAAGWKDFEESAPERDVLESASAKAGSVESGISGDELSAATTEAAEAEGVEEGEETEGAAEGTAEDEFVAEETQPEGEEVSASASVTNPPGHSRFEVRTRRRRRRRGRGGQATAAAPVPVVSAAIPAAPRQQRERRAEPRLINELLREGQEILVQIAKEPLGKKGARITSHLALPGRYLVYMPTVTHIGVSRKIASDEERARLKRIILENSKDLVGGFIVRTAGQGASEEEFKADIRFLSNLWAEMRQQFEKVKAPALLHHDLNLVERTLRDQLSDEFTHIWVDNDEQYQRVVRFVNYFMPHLTSRIRLYTREEPLFDHFGLQEEINKALKSKVWLKSGGYIVINQTEALVAIDVNTGKYVGKSNRLEDTIVKTNVDAIREIVRQIRLRDLGGIIVIDFIDMDERRNRQKVMQMLEEAMRSDRAPSKLLSFNDFGLVALTRKRVKQSLERTLGSPCPYCAGVGLVKSVTTVCNEIYSEARKIARNIERDDMVLRVNPEVAKAMKAKGAALLGELEEATNKTISVQADPSVHQEQFEIF